MSADDFGPLFRDFLDLTKGLSPEEVEALKRQFAEFSQRAAEKPIELAGLSNEAFIKVIENILAKLDEIIGGESK